MRGTALSSTAATAAVALAFLTTTTADAAVPDGTAYCKPDQIDTALSPLDSHMGRTSGEVQFRAKPGNSCLLLGAPVLLFQDASGQLLPIAAEYPKDQTAPARVDATRAASATFSFERIDERTGEPRRGPIPDRVAVARPIPGESTTVDRPWDRRIEVPGPVEVGPVRESAAPAPGPVSPASRPGAPLSFPAR
jgi:hypothetical protein